MRHIFTLSKATNKILFFKKTWQILWQREQPMAHFECGTEATDFLSLSATRLLLDEPKCMVVVLFSIHWFPNAEIETYLKQEMENKQLYRSE